MKIILVSGLLLALLGAQTKDLSGTWVAKRETPMGEMELVYELKVYKGRITGMQRMPFGDSPIVDGKIDGDQFELTVETEFFGNVQKRVVKGQIVGDALKIELAMPGPPPGMGPPGIRPAGPGGPPGDPGAPSGNPMSGPVIFHRGTPTPSYRAPTVDYKSLPKVDLPPITPLEPNGLAKTPPMGWNSWNRFRTKIDDKTVRDIANAMVANGMRDAGYVYVNIDDGWQGRRDEDGVLQPNPGFPNMKALADYIHGKGLKLGMYSSPGPRTCGGFEGSYAHEELDARTWASWGIDYLKYDWCSASRLWKDEDMRAAYQKMGEALLRNGRPIVYSLCQYGRANVQEWGPLVAGNPWRTTMDIRDQWQSMIAVGLSQATLAPFVGPGAWNDPDMLEVGNGGMTHTEYQTHFGLWAMLSAPLIAGNDVRNMSPTTREILLNKEVIAIDQDPLGRAAHRVLKSGDMEVWQKPLSGGAYAVGVLNLAATETGIAIPWNEFQLPKARRVRDVWRHADLGRVESELKTTVPPHGMLLLRVSP